MTPARFLGGLLDGQTRDTRGALTYIVPLLDDDGRRVEHGYERTGIVTGEDGSLRYVEMTFAGVGRWRSVPGSRGARESVLASRPRPVLR